MAYATDPRAETGAIEAVPAGPHAPAEPDEAIALARRRFGGIDVPATLAGAIVGVSLFAVFAWAMVMAFGAAWAAGRLSTADLWPQGLSVGFGLAIAFLAAGWTSGRMARYSGSVNGALVALWTFAMVMAIVVAAGAVGITGRDLAESGVPRWLLAGDPPLLRAGVVAGGAAVMFSASALGGWLGERYHRRADALLASQRVP